MSESSTTQAQSVLLLDNNEADAQHLCALLQSVPLWQLDTTVHLSSEGILPTAGSHFDLLLVTDDYAALKLRQVIELAKFYQPQAHIVLLGTSMPGARSPQQFIDAGRAGVSYWLQKDNISLTTLKSLLQQVLNRGEQKAPLAQPAPGAIPAPVSSAANVDAEAAAENNSSVERVDTLIDAISVGIIIFAVADDGFVYRRMNRTAAESTQLEPQQLIGKRLANDAINLENFDLFNALRHVCADATAQTHRIMNLGDDASISWREIGIRPLQGGELLVEIQDITERIHLAAERRYSEKIWWHIAKSLPDLCVTLDENGRVNRVISGQWQQFNIASDTLPGQPISEFLAQDERGHCSQTIQKALNTGKTQTAVYALDSAEIQVRLHVKVALLHVEVDAPRQVIWLARDISEGYSEPQHVTDTANITPQLLAETLQHAPFMAAISNADGRYEHVNAAVTRHLQQPAEAIVGRADTELFAGEVALTLQRLDQKLLAEGVAQQCEIALTTEGEEQLFRIIKIPLSGMSSATQNIFTLALPVSTLTASTLTTRPEAAENNQPLQQVAVQQESIDELVGDIARDFNDVLVNLTEHTRVALDDSGGEPTSEITNYLHAVMNSSQRARDLVVHMMALQTSDQKTAKPGTADLTLLMNGIVELLRNTIGQHLQITSDLQQALQVEEIDSLRMQNAFIQLFRVAQQCFDASGHLSVCMRTLTQQDHECAYCYGKVRGDFIVISMHNSMRTNADAIDDFDAELPQDETLLVQIKRIHELLKPYSGHIVLRGRAEEEQSWYVFLATAADKEHALKLCPQQD